MYLPNVLEENEIHQYKESVWGVSLSNTLCTYIHIYIEIGDLRNSSLLFADDVVLLELSKHNLQLLLNQITAACEVAGTRISTSKCDTMSLSHKKAECLLQVGGEMLLRVKKLWYLAILFTSKGRIELEINRKSNAASAVMRTLEQSVMVKRGLSQKARLHFCRQSIFLPSPVVTNSGYWANKNDRTYKWLKWVSFRGSLDPPSEIGGEVLSFERDWVGWLWLRKMKRTKAEQNTKRWTLKKEECRVAFREELRRGSGWSGGASRWLDDCS